LIDRPFRRRRGARPALAKQRYALAAKGLELEGNSVHVEFLGIEERIASE